MRRIKAALASSTILMTKAYSNWSRHYNGFDGSNWDCCFHHLYGNMWPQKLVDDRFRYHLLLEFLDYLKVVHYVKDYDGCYEIEIKVRHGSI
jgi:hypothetical protein